LPLFDQWKNPDAILDMADIYVYKRKGYQVESPDNNKVLITAAPEINISSTGIREEVAHGRNISKMVSESVFKIIQEEGFYKESGQGTLDN